MKTFEAKAMGDTIHFSAPSLEDAKEQLVALCGEMPNGMVKWRELDSLPDGDEYAADMRS